jgi:hypothetical protein
MAETVDLEIGLHHREAGSYAVELRAVQPGSETDTRAEGPATFDLAALRDLIIDPAAYGQALKEALFAAPKVREVFSNTVTIAQRDGIPLRVRLLIGSSAPELNSLLWETLRNPLDDTPLCSNQNILFSRYLSSLDWSTVRLRSQGALRALIAIANPSNLSDNQLAPVDVAGELKRARAGLGAATASDTSSGQSDSLMVLAAADAAAPSAGPAGAGPRTTLSNIIARLRDAPVDILYLVCHGALVKDEPMLWLEDDSGKIARTSGSELALVLKELQQPPRLIVLASCESAGNSAGNALSALGPRLAEVGIPAVLAMQGKISMDTVAQFMPVFFTELARDGQVDRAVSAARGAVRTRPDQWMPVLFSRLKSNKIWYNPGFGDDRKGFEKWPAIIRSLRRGQATPILGSSLLESYVGGTRQIARRWAETYQYPLEPCARDDLPQVAQFLSVNQDKGFPRDELESYLRRMLIERFSPLLPDNLRAPNSPLDDVVGTIGAQRQASDSTEPHRILAQLGLPIYITTNPDNLLATALKTAGRTPEVELCPWNEYVEQADSIYTREPDYRPSPERPLVYHLFGRLNVPDSVVLTEDDYFDFLIGVTSNKDLIPSVVRRALADTALLFLGFRLDEWDFRVLFRSIMGQQGGGRRSRYAHVAVQLDPEEDRILEPDRARKYLESYFQGADISIYWGSAEDFLKELQQRWNEMP